VTTKEAKELYPVTGMTKMLGDLIGRTEAPVRRAQDEMYQAAAEVRKYETLLASARERHEIAQREYRTLRGLLQIGWEQLQADIKATKPLPESEPISDPA
jgi:chromosome segregation ATPase